MIFNALSEKASKVFAKLSDLAKYLPLTGGTVSGNVTQSHDGDYIKHTFQNGNRIISLMLSKAGSIGLYDESTGKWLFLWGKDSDGTFNGTATNADKLDGHDSEYFATATALKNAMKSYQYDGGTAKDDETLNSLLQSFHDNATDLTHYQNGIYISYESQFSGGHKWVEGYRQSANYGWQKITYWQNGCPREHWRSLYSGTWSEWFKVPDINDLAKYLPLTGGTVKAKYDRYAIIVEAENADSGASTIRYSLAGTVLGEIGISSTNGAFYREGATNTNYKLHHDGNSAKVHIGTSAPSDTTALWIDTSA